MLSLAVALWAMRVSQHVSHVMSYLLTPLHSKGGIENGD